MITGIPLPNREEQIIDEKRQFIQGYIDEAEKLLENKQTKEYGIFFDKCLHLFSKESAEVYSIWGGWKATYKDNDVKTLIEALKKYKIDLALSSFKKTSGKTGDIVFNNQNTTNAKIEITITTTIQQLNEIKGLSADDNITLQKMLFEIEELKKSKDKTLWDKIKKTYLWVLDKGVDVAVATIPYLIGMAK